MKPVKLDFRVFRGTSSAVNDDVHEFPLLRIVSRAVH